jgi:hypothetical protein
MSTVFHVVAQSAKNRAIFAVSELGCSGGIVSGFVESVQVYAVISDIRFGFACFRW